MSFHDGSWRVASALPTDGIEQLPDVPGAAPLHGELFAMRIPSEESRCIECAHKLRFLQGSPRLEDLERALRDSAPRPIEDLIREHREAYRVSGPADPLKLVILASDRTPLLQVGELVSRMEALGVDHVFIASASEDGTLRGVPFVTGRDDVRYLPEFEAFIEGCSVAPGVRLEVTLGSVDILVARKRIATGCSTRGKGPAIPATPAGDVDVVELRRCISRIQREGRNLRGAIVAEPWMRVSDFVELMAASSTLQVLLPPRPPAAG